MAWTDLTFNFGAILTSTQMTQLDTNFDALAAGDSGAPRISESALDPSIGPWVLLATLDASTGTTVETATSALSGYSEIRIIGTATHGDATSRDLYMRMKNGATVITASNYGVAGVEYGSTPADGQVLAAAFFDLSNGTVAAVAAGSLAPVDMTFRHHEDAAQGVDGVYHYANAPTTNASNRVNGRMVYPVAQVFDGVQFYWSGSVAFTGGSFKVWGRK